MEINNDFDVDSFIEEKMKEIQQELIELEKEKEILVRNLIHGE